MKIPRLLGLVVLLVVAFGVLFHVYNVVLCLLNRRPDNRSTFSTFWNPLFDWSLLTPKGKSYARRCYVVPIIFFSVFITAFAVEGLLWIVRRLGALD